MKDTSIIYEEVYEILNFLNKETVNKIPFEIINMFNKKRDKDYKSRINKNDFLNENNIEKETLDILLYLDLKYFSTEEQKKALLKKYKENLKIQENKKKEVYNFSSPFDNRITKKYANDIAVLPTVVKKNRLHIFIDKLKDFLKLKNRE